MTGIPSRFPYNFAEEFVVLLLKHLQLGNWHWTTKKTSFQAICQKMDGMPSGYKFDTEDTEVFISDLGQKLLYS